MKRNSKTSGFTAVELMLALALLAMGSAGVITMQRVTAQSNRHAKALTTATRIAEAWLDQLVADSSNWRGSPSFARTDWLLKQEAVTFSQGTQGWFQPDYIAARGWGFAFDMTGSPQAAASKKTAFCTDLRLTWLYPEVATSSQGAGLIRAEVRVYWPRSGVSNLAIPMGTDPCAWTEAQVTSAEGLKAYHFVHMSTAVLQHDSSI